MKAGPRAAGPRAAAPRAAAFPFALIIVLVSACRSPAPQGEPTADRPSRPASDSLETYVEGSRDVWDAARHRGLTFRAVGQEPGWLLEIGSAAMTLITDYGADTLALPVPQPISDPVARTTIYRVMTQENEVLVTIREEPCVDTMSGERFSRAVSVAVNGKELDGCGRELGGAAPRNGLPGS